MANELEKALERAKYMALPLPRTKSEPTTIFAFDEGQLYIVRNPHSCFPNPPIAVTIDPAVDTIMFTRQFTFQLKGITSFLTKLFGIGHAGAELSAKDIRSATVQMGGLSHFTIETGALIDYLASQAETPCMRDLLDPTHYTIVAALNAQTFTYTFKSSKGAVVKLKAPEAQGLFQVGADVQVSVTSEGQVVVNSPRFIGVVVWDGTKIRQELEKATRSTRPRTLGLTRAKVPSALDNALDPKSVRAAQAKSLGLAPKSRALKPAAKTVRRRG
jgi:hypothetical protein